MAPCTCCRRVATRTFVAGRDPAARRGVATGPQSGKLRVHVSHDRPAQEIHDGGTRYGKHAN